MNKLSKDAVGYIQIGMIVGQVNIIETNIDWIIAEYYTNAKDSSPVNLRFQSEVLNSGMIRLDDKIKLLQQVAAAKGVEYTKKVDNDLRQWRKIRNIVAHGLPMHRVDGNTFIMQNGEYHDINKLREGFGKRQDRITDFLHTLLPKSSNGS